MLNTIPKIKINNKPHIKHLQFHICISLYAYSVMKKDYGFHCLPKAISSTNQELSSMHPSGPSRLAFSLDSLLPPLQINLVKALTRKCRENRFRVSFPKDEKVTHD